MAIQRQISGYGLVLALLLAGGINPAGADERGGEPFRAHMQSILTVDDEWRTPNPDYEAGKRQPREYALQLRMQPDGRHALGELMGVYDDGARVTYWSLIAMYNPVTQKVVTQQIGWDGTFLYGENDVQTGDSETVDMIEYNVNGTMKIVRHTSRYIGTDVHESDVYERDEDGEWILRAQWTWRRVAGAEPGSAAGEHTAGAIGEHVGYLVSGGGRWRSPNPDYAPGSDEPESFGMNFRWGQRKRYVIGEIVSIAGDGAISKDWSLYVTFNPVTGDTHLYQTGSSGVYFSGELGVSPTGRHSQTGLVYLPNGTVRSVRDEVEIPDENARISHVFERDATGGWTKVREWNWTLATESGT